MHLEPGGVRVGPTSVGDVHVSMVMMRWRGMAVPPDLRSTRGFASVVLVREIVRRERRTEGFILWAGAAVGVECNNEKSTLLLESGQVSMTEHLNILKTTWFVNRVESDLIQLLPRLLLLIATSRKPTDV